MADEEPIVEDQSPWTFHEDWQPENNEPISAKEAAKILTERLAPQGPSLGRKIFLSPLGMGGSDTAEESLVKRLYYLVPPAMRTRAVFERADLTPILFKLVLPNDDDSVKMIEGTKFTANDRRIATEWFATERDSTINALMVDEDILKTVGVTATSGISTEQSAAARQLAETMVTDSMNGTLIPVREGAAPTDPNQVGDSNTKIEVDSSGRVVVSSLNGDYSPLFGDIQAGDSTVGYNPQSSFLTQDDLKILLQSGATPESVITKYQGDQSQRAYDRSSGFLTPLDTTNVAMHGAGPPGGIGRGPDFDGSQNARGQYTVNQALFLPGDMTRAEVVELSEKMRRAGIYAQQGSEPVIEGSSTDPAFIGAWRSVIGQTIQNGKPISSWLVEQGDLLEQQKEEKKAKGVGVLLSDPSLMRLTANSLARQTLGRHLDPEEQNQLVKMMHQFEKDRGIQMNDQADNPSDVEDVDWAARMEEQIRADNPGEAGAHDVADQYNTFRSMLSGPGRMMNGG